MLGQTADEVMLHQTVLETVDRLGLQTVELEDVSVFHVLIDAVQIVDGPCLLRWCLEQIDAEAEIGLVIAQVVQDGGHDVDLLGNGILHAHAHLACGVVEDDRHTETTQICLILLMGRRVRMICGNGEDGVLEPRLLAGAFEETAQGIVCVLDHIVDGQLPSLEDILIRIGHAEGVMA